MNFLLLTAHDYRTPRKANMHFIADELARRGVMRFFSLRYSALSKRKNDARVFLDARANRVELYDGVECYLWKTPIHPFNTRRRWLRPVEDLFFRWTMGHPPETLVRWIREADVIFFESGSAILHIALAERLNPRARRVYIASDALDAIEVAAFVEAEFDRVAPGMDALCLPSPRLADDMPASRNKYFVPHGLDATIADRAGPSPYSSPRNAVSVGSMLFDRTFFELAAPAFPDLQFHVIGSGLADHGGFPDNVHLHDEMAYEDTLAYVKHADVGIAPYAAAAVPAYLTDTSMKLMQYAFFGVPAVCPTSVAGARSWRFGYTPGSRNSIVAAMQGALGAGPFQAPHALGWDEVTDRLIDPTRFPDTHIDA